MRYHVVASGSDTHPPIEQQFDDDPMPSLIARGYRVINCALLTPVSREAITADLDGRKYE